MDECILKVKDILPEAKETVTILLERADGRSLAYRAGQFLTLLLRELRRSYSFSSTPGVDSTAAITVKRVANGEVSRYLLDHLRVGDELVSLPPAGRFVLEEGSAVKLAAPLESGKSPGGIVNDPEAGRSGVPASRRWLFFIAAGSGMAPVFSLLKEGSSAILERDLRPAPSGGRPLFYLCGPPAFMRMVQFTLRVMGFADEQIRQEHFTVEYVPPPPLLTDTTPKKVTVYVGGDANHGGGQPTKGYEHETAARVFHFEVA